MSMEGIHLFSIDVNEIDWVTPLTIVVHYPYTRRYWLLFAIVASIFATVASICICKQKECNSNVWRTQPKKIRASINGVTSTNAATFGLGAAQVLAIVVSKLLADKAGCRLLLLDAACDATTMYIVC